jgi:transposase
MKTHVGVDLHQRFCYCVALDASGKLIASAPVVNQQEALRHWIGKLPAPRQVVMEACGFWPAFARAVSPVAERLVMVHPLRVKAIASAKLKNDRVDATTLAHLSRCDLLPEAWMAPWAVQERRLTVRRRRELGQKRAAFKNLLQSVLHQQGLSKPCTDVFGKRGRAWLAEVEMSPAARAAVAGHLRVIATLDEEIRLLERELKTLAASDERARWLMTMPGVGAYSALMVLAEIGDVARFANQRALVNYAGLAPRVRESAGKAKRGHISRQGSEHLRWIMVQAAQIAARCSPPVKAAYLRLKLRKPPQVAITIIARKLLTCAWALLRHGVCFDPEVFMRAN